MKTLITILLLSTFALAQDSTTVKIIDSRIAQYDSLYKDIHTKLDTPVKNAEELNNQLVQVIAIYRELETLKAILTKREDEDGSK